MNLDWTIEAFTEKVIFVTGDLSGEAINCQAEFVYENAKTQGRLPTRTGLVAFFRASEVEKLKIDDRFDFNEKTFTTMQILEDTLGITKVIGDYLMASDDGKREKKSGILL